MKVPFKAGLFLFYELTTKTVIQIIKINYSERWLTLRIDCVENCKTKKPLISQRFCIFCLVTLPFREEALPTITMQRYETFAYIY